MAETEKNSSTEQNEKQTPPFNATGEKRVDIGILLALFLGFFGAHHFYLGRWKMGVAYLVLGSLTLLSIPLALIDCFRMKTLVTQANNTKVPSVDGVANPIGERPLASGVSKENILLGMPAKYVLGFAGVLGGLIVILVAFNSISSMMATKKVQKEFEQNRDEIVAVAQKALDEGDFNKAKSIGLKHRMSHDPELGKILSTAESKLTDKKRHLVERLNRARGRIFPFKLLDYSDSSIPKRKRVTWTIVAHQIETVQDAAATGIYAAKLLHKKLNADTVSVTVEYDTSIALDGNFIANINYIPDGLGFSGENSSKIWNIRIGGELPSQILIKRLALRKKLRNSYIEKYGDDKFSEKLTQHIMSELNLSEDEYFSLDGSFHGRSDYPYDEKAFSFSSVNVESEIAKTVEGAGSIADKANWNEFYDYLKRKDLLGIIEKFAVQGMNIKIKVKNSWHYEPKQIRLQVTQQFWEQWQMIVSTTNPDEAIIIIADLNGNRVGGSNIIKGSMIDVQD